MVRGRDGLAGFNSGRFRSTPRGGVDSSPHAEPKLVKPERTASGGKANLTRLH
jgi:hypothetical protein